MTTPPAPYCCRNAAFEGYEISHAEVCPYRQEPQPDALVSLSDYKTEEGGPQT